MGQRRRPRQAEAQRVEAFLEVGRSARAGMDGEAGRLVDHQDQPVAMQHARLDLLAVSGGPGRTAARLAPRRVARPQPQRSGHRSSQALARLVDRRGAQDRGLVAEAAEDLQADRQAVAGEAAAHRDRGMAGDVERHGVGEPVAAQLADLDAVDHDRLEQVLVDRQRGARQRRRHQVVGRRRTTSAPCGRGRRAGTWPSGSRRRSIARPSPPGGPARASCGCRRAGSCRRSAPARSCG